MVSRAAGPQGEKLHHVGVYGASGTSGTELVRLIDRHPAMALRFATSRSFAGQSLTTVDPAAPDVLLTDPADADAQDAELAFCCLPHGHSAPIAEACLKAGARVVDLSGDFRLSDPDVHGSIYGSERDADVAASAVYGLTEMARADLADTQLVANPGCYPTCATMGLAPLVRRGWVLGPVIIDAKSGVSGAGRGPSASTQFVAVADDVRPYKLGRAHRHAVEIEQTLGRLVPAHVGAPTVIFNPHVVPIERGMLATMVVRMPGISYEKARDAIRADYEGEPLVNVLEAGPARIRAVARTNRVQIGVADVPGTDHVVITSVIDNLGKGAAGQAMQNANRMLGLPETLGVDAHAMEVA